MVVGIGILDDPCADLIAFGNVILLYKITGRVTDPPLQNKKEGLFRDPLKY